MVWNPVFLYLSGMLNLLIVICGIQHLVKGKKNDNKDEKLILFGFSAMFFCFALGAILLLLSLSFLPGTYTNDTFYVDYDNRNFQYEILIRIGMCSIFSGFIFSFFTIEKALKNTKYVLSILSCSGVVIIAFLPFNLFLIFIGIVYMTNLSSFLILLLLYTKWSRLEFKAVTAFILLGIILITFSGSLRVAIPSGRGNNIFLIIEPIAGICAFLSILTPTIIDPKKYSNALKYWKNLGALIIGLQISFVFIHIIFEFPVILTSSAIFFLILVSFFVLYTIYSIKTQMRSERNPNAKEIDLIKIITKPQKVTEEEVSISKERKVCLVCKNKISRVNYICPGCDTHYCVNCSDALSDTENACWVCGTPFDESKPVKKDYIKKLEVKFERYNKRKGA